MAEMTEESLIQLCNSMQNQGIYRTPEINDKLYLHCQGYRTVSPEAMKRYTGLKVLWLQSNGLTGIQGLDTCTKLRTLYLHENVIEVMENLDYLVELDTLNISKNFVRKVSGLSKLTRLTTLILAHNNLGPDKAAVEHVLVLPNLQTLDLQSNRLEDAAIVEEVAGKLAGLRVLYLQGNSVVKAVRHYRKVTLAACPDLKYLDDRPVFEDERRRVTAWAPAFKEGGQPAGQAAEQAEIKLIREEKVAAETRRFQQFEELMRGSAARAAADPPPVPTVNPYSSENIVPNRESDAAREMREKRVERLVGGGDKALDVDADALPPPPPPPAAAAAAATPPPPPGADAPPPPPPPAAAAGAADWPAPPAAAAVPAGDHTDFGELD